MLEAKLESKAIGLLTDLTWVRRKLEVAGPADIINDYIKVNKLLEEEEVSQDLVTLVTRFYVRATNLERKKLVENISNATCICFDLLFCYKTVVMTL